MNCKSLRKNAVDEMLENVGLFDVRDRYANKLSGGMKRRLGIAQALIHHPKVIIVDEPTTGLDPEGADSFSQSPVGSQRKRRDNYPFHPYRGRYIEYMQLYGAYE